VNKIEQAIYELHRLDHMALQTGFPYDLHPVIKLLCSLFYIILLMSVSNYDVATVLTLGVYLYLTAIITDQSMWQGLKRMRYIIFIFLLLGTVNILLDRRVVGQIGGLTMTMGMLSMMTLVLKSSFALIMSYFLIATTGMEGICEAFHDLHVPDILITTIMLIYRYMIVFLKEVERIWLCYRMRAPGQKGLNYHTWGSVIGSLMLRSIDKATDVYTSMQLRGYNPEVMLVHPNKITSRDILIVMMAVLILCICRFVPIWAMIGGFLR